jgi:hypothetical protein
MSTFTYQVLKDTQQKTVIKLTGTFTDSTAEVNASRITANSLFGAMDNSYTRTLANTANNGSLPYYGLEITKLWYDVNMYNTTGKGHVELFWSGNNATNGVSANDAMIFAASDIGNWDEHGSYANIVNNSPSPYYGNIGIRTYGQQANCSYTIVMELRKNNYQYERGQFEDPAAFNYGPNYSPRP